MQNPILDKVARKLLGWRGSLLSQAKKFQLVQSTLQCIPVYFMSIFKMPTTITAKLDQIQKKFLWSRSKIKKRIPLVDQEKVCVKKKLEGLGMRSLKEMNKALIGKFAWNLITKESLLWTRILRSKYLWNPRYFLNRNLLPKGFDLWNNLLKSRDLIRKSSRWRIRKGLEVNFQNDKWLEDTALKDNPLLNPLMKEHLI